MKPSPAAALRPSCRGLIAVAALCAAGIASAREPVTDDFRCLTSGGAKPIHLEFRMFSDPNSNWSGGYVKYKGAKRAIPVVPGKTETLDKPAGRPWEFQTTWHEIVEGKVTGQYVVMTQGANIYAFTYRNVQTGKSFDFSQDAGAMGDSECEWK